MNESIIITAKIIIDKRKFDILKKNRLSHLILN